MENNDLPDVDLSGNNDFSSGGGGGGDEEDNGKENGPLGHPLMAKATNELRNLNASKIGYILASIAAFCLMIGFFMFPMILVSPGTSLYWFSLSSFFAILSMVFLLGRERFVEGFLTGVRRLYFGGWTVSMFLSWWYEWSGPLGITSSIGAVSEISKEVD